MKFNDLKKWQKLLIYMYTHNDIDTFTVAKYGDDVIKYGIVKNKNALYPIINDLRENSYIYNPGDGYLLTNDGCYYCDDLYQQINSYPWDIDEDEYAAQPNISENSAAASVNDSKTIVDKLILIMHKQGSIELKNDIGWLMARKIIKASNYKKGYANLSSRLQYLKNNGNLAENRTRGYWTLTDDGKDRANLLRQHVDDINIPTRRAHSLYKNVSENIEHKNEDVDDGSDEAMENNDHKVEILIDGHKDMTFNVQTNDQLNITFNNGNAIKIKIA